MEECWYMGFDNGKEYAFGCCFGEPKYPNIGVCESAEDYFQYYTGWEMGYNSVDTYVGEFDSGSVPRI